MCEVAEVMPSASYVNIPNARHLASVTHLQVVWTVVAAFPATPHLDRV